MPEKTRAIEGKLPDGGNRGNTGNDAARLAQLASAAAERAADYLRTVARPEASIWASKGHHDFVTHVDRGAEEIIRDVLGNAEPSSRFLGEELSPDDTLSGLVWVIDPLDGTTNFLHGYPWWSVSIAATLDGEPVAGAVINVPANHHYRAWVGGGAWRNDERIVVSTIADPGLALLGTGFPFKTPQDLPAYLEQCRRIFPATSGVRRAGSAALDLATVACGEFEAYWEITLAPWDMAAGMLLVREAGGVVTDLGGKRAVVGHGGLVAGNPAMQGWLLEQVRQAKVQSGKVEGVKWEGGK